MPPCFPRSTTRPQSCRDDRFPIVHSSWKTDPVVLAGPWILATCEDRNGSRNCSISSIEPVVPNRTTVRRLLSDAAFVKLAGDPVMVLPARRASRRLARYLPGLLLALVLVQAISARADEPPTDALVPPSPMPEGAVTPVPTPSPAIRLWQDRSLGTLKASLKPTEGELPTNVAAPHLAEAGTRYHCFGESRSWMLASVEWEAAATRHLPLFFEDPNVERLGYTYGLLLEHLRL